MDIVDETTGWVHDKQGALNYRCVRVIGGLNRRGGQRAGDRCARYGR